MKRTLCLFLALILAVGICFSAPVTITASAAEAVTSGNCGASTNTGGESSVTWAYDSATTTLTISGEGEMAVFTSTSMPWYSDRGKIKTIVINEGVKSIGKYSFYNCTALTSVTIPESVTSIGYGAFGACKALPSVTIPEGVKTIGNNAFSNCYELISITIPESVTTIGEYAFSGCESLTTVTIGDSVTTIGNYAFRDCTNLTSVTIPKNVTTIGRCAFKGCAALTSINVDGANTTYSSVDGVLFNANKTELICYPAGRFETSYTVPESVTTIGEGAFTNCTSLTSVTIGDRVTTIGWQTFYDCTALTSVTIGKGVTEIDDYAFYGCSELTSVTIPESVTSIGNYAFSNCKKLILTVEPGSYAHNYVKTNSIPYIFNGYNEAETAQIEKLIFTLNADSESYSVTGCDTQISGALKIPATYNGKPVTTIGSSAFNNCTALESVTIGESVTTIGECAFRCCTSLASLTIGDSVTTIGECAFLNCTALESVTIGESVTTIGESAFHGCISLKTIKIPNSVTTIDNSAFFNCTALESVTIGESVTTIGESAFYDCTSLTSVTIGESVTTIGNFAFYGCTNLATIEIPDSVTTIGASAFEDCEKLETVTIGEAVQTIGSYAFDGCTSLASVTIPESVTTIGESAFYGCTSLASVTIPESVTTIGESTFYGCEDVNLIVEPGSKAHEFAKTNSIPYIFNGYTDTETDQIEKLTFTEIHNDNNEDIAYSVTGCDKEISGELKIPATYNGKPVTTIGEDAFKGCSELASVTIPDSITTIGSSAFNDCTSLTTIEIPDSVTSIGRSAFSTCTALTSVMIPESVTTIDYYTFYSCTALKSVTIPESVTSIGRSAFECCTSLTSVTIPKNVTTIGRYAFDGCAKLISINVDGANTEYSSEDGVLFNANKTELICYPAGKTETSYTVPESVTTIGEGAFVDCTALTSVTIPESVTTIGIEAFYGCTALETVTILSSEIVIEANAFYDCTSLTTVKVPCNWNTENPPYAFDENVNVAVAEHKEMVYVDNNDGTHTAKYPCCGTVIGEPEKHSFNESEYCEFCKYQCPHPNYTNGRCDVCACYCPHTNTEPVYNSYENDTNQHYKHYECCGVVEWAGYHEDENGDTKCDQCNVQLVVKVHLRPATSMGIHNGDNYFTSLENAIEKANEILDGGDLILLSDAVINSEKALTIDKNKLDTNGKKLTVNGTLVLPDSEYTGATIPTGVVGSGTVKIGENFFKLADKGKWCCAEESQHASSVQTCVGYLCELCGNYYGEANDNHDIVIDKAVEATCTKTGLTEGSHCTRCDDKTVAQEVVPALNHKDTLVQVEAKAPTCEAIGWAAYEYCTACNYTTYVEKAKLGHDIVSHSAKSATCEAIGWYAYDTCSRCDYTTYKEIAKLGHDIVIDKAVEATCTKTGLTEGSHCTRCNDKTVKQNVIPTKAHTEVTVTGKAATCTANGLTDGKKCSVCGATTVAQQVIPATGHNSNTKVPAVSATCAGTGLTEGAKCSVCGVTTKAQEVVPATGHKPTLVGKKDATTKEAGYTGDKVCSVCNAEIEKGKEIPKIIVSLATPTVTIKNTAKGIEVNWNAIENAESYIVYRSIYNASTKKWSKWGTIKTGVTETSFVDGTVKLGTSYKYTVRAVNGDVKSSYVGTKALKYNIIPTVKIANTATGVKVAWSTAANATGYTVYRLQYNTKTKKWSNWKNMGTAKANKTSWVDKKVTSGVSYKYTVRAANGKILSSYKASASLMFLSQPTVKFANASTGVKVAWSKVKGATGYTVYRSELVDGEWTKWSNRGTAKANKSSWVDKKVTSGVTYKYTVRAINGKVKSSYVETKGLLYLAQPTVTVKAVTNGINVAWSQCEGATGYTVYRSEYNTKTKKWSKWSNRGTAKAEKSNWTDKKATKGVTYKYTVRAVNADTGAKSSYIASKNVKR